MSIKPITGTMTYFRLVGLRGGRARGVQGGGGVRGVQGHAPPDNFETLSF